MKSDEKEHKENETEKKENKHEMKENKKFENKVHELEDEMSNLKDNYLRKQAEFENFRKRLEKEKESFLKFANESIMKDTVSFLDNLERAIDSSKQSKDFDNLLEGITMIEKEILSSFEKKYNLVKFGEIGDEFDPTRHEAISTIIKDGLKHTEVVEVYQKGYCYNDRILRTAKVKVAQSN